MNSTFRLTKTKHSSSRFGKCECCGQYVAEVWYQVEERPVTLTDAERAIAGSKPGIIRHDQQGVFGHYECLAGLQVRA